MAGASGHISSHKKLLQNYIRHAGAHNKIKEETEMWYMRHRELTSDQSEYKLKSREERERGGSMRSHRHKVPARSVCGGNMYQRELMKMKEADPTRWGHSGYKELYPEDFVSSESSGSEEEEEEEKSYRARERAKARKRSVPDPEISSHKKRRKETKQKKSKKTKTEKELQEKEGRRKKKKKHKRHKRVAESPSSSQSSGHDKR